MAVRREVNERWYPTSNAPSRKMNYRARLRSRPAYAAATDFQIELSILRAWKKLHGPDCPMQLKFFRELATSRWEHRMASVLAWDREFVKNPWSDLIFENLDMLESGKQMVNIIGSQNSTKSNSVAAFLVQLLIEDPEYVGCFIASPYREATRLGIWGNVKENFRKVAPMMGWNADDCIKDSVGTITVPNNTDRAGWIQVVSVDKVGMLQGKKPRTGSRGRLYLLIEESGAFDKTPSKAVWDVLQNLTGQPGFKCLSTCNFKSVFGLDGRLCRPLSKEWEQLNPDEDFHWDSVLNGHTMRLDGHQSPNKGKKVKLFPFIVGDQDAERMIAAGHGPRSEKYLEQIRSFPMVGVSDFTVTNMTKLRAGGVFQHPEEYLVHQNRTGKWAFADPSLGGDPYKVAIAEEKRLGGPEGGKIVMRPVSMEVIELEKDRRWNAEDIALANSINPEHGHQVGQEFTPEHQGSLQVAKLLRDHGIPATQFGFDGSMRASVQRGMDLFIGTDALAMDYLGASPDERMPSGIGRANDLYSNFNTFLWFLAADMFESGFIREGDAWLAAMEQMCSRLWEFAGKRKAMESKDDFKERNANESPNDADAVVGLMYLLYTRSGWFDRGRPTPTGTGGLEYLLKKVSNSGAGRYREDGHIGSSDMLEMANRESLMWRR